VGQRADVSENKEGNATNRHKPHPFQAKTFLEGYRSDDDIAG